VGEDAFLVSSISFHPSPKIKFKSIRRFKFFRIVAGEGFVFLLNIDRNNFIFEIPFSYRMKSFCMDDLGGTSIGIERTSWNARNSRDQERTWYAIERTSIGLERSSPIARNSRREAMSS
jgi:hypothetical protein